MTEPEVEAIVSPFLMFICSHLEDHILHDFTSNHALGTIGRPSTISIGVSHTFISIKLTLIETGS